MGKNSKRSKSNHLVGLFCFCMGFATVLLICKRSNMSTPREEHIAPIPGGVEYFQPSETDKHTLMEERRQRIRKICDERGENLRWSKTVKNKFWLVDYAHKLAYCRIPKAGTTTLIRHFLELSDLSEEKKTKMKSHHISLHGKVANMFRVKQNEMAFDKINSDIKENSLHAFVFVRHPFERIVSAYKDKMVENQPPPYQELIKEIGTSFRAFIDHIISTVDQAYEDGCNLKQGGCPNMDEHFAPFYSWCALCDIPYETIGKAETFDEDFAYLIEKTGLQDVLKSDYARMHSTNHSQDEAKDHFKTLTQKQKERLLEIYSLDFELFGYDPIGYLGHS